MINKWTRYIFWQPFETFCRHFPLVPFRTEISIYDEHIKQVKIENIVTKTISRLGGGYDYSVLYLIDNHLLIDTGYPWARRSLKKYLQKSGADKSIVAVVNTHAHEDHTGNNDLISQITSAKIYAHTLALANIKYPAELPWYRNFMFGPFSASFVEEIPKSININKYNFEIIHTPGHSADHICLFERNKGWLFSGDLYISPDLDSQLSEVNGHEWIKSLERIIELKAEWMFDAHGKIYRGEELINKVLSEKLQFLNSLRDRILEEAKNPLSIKEITKRVFNRNTFIDHISFSDGWLSLLTSSDFARSNLVQSFLKKAA